MVTVIIWGIIITIIVVTVEFSNWRSSREMNRRISKLEKCKEHGKGKETKERKEAPTSEETGC
jgi:hypothetical protein